MSDESERFESERRQNVMRAGADLPFRQLSRRWQREASRYNYVFNFSWLGRPIVQLPPDIIAIQELIWAIRPNLIIETGIAHGGSLVFSASMLELNAACGGPSDAQVLGIDIDIRPHNREAIEAHPLFRRISMIEGSSVAHSVIDEVRRRAQGRERVLVFLDSNHTHDHVLAELEAYAPLVSVGSYCIVFDTAIEEMPTEMFADRPWGPGNSPGSAASEYLRKHPEFEIDRMMDGRVMISVAPNGYLRRVG